jgi:hypothetical protein
VVTSPRVLQFPSSSFRAAERSAKKPPKAAGRAALFSFQYPPIVCRASWARDSRAETLLGVALAPGSAVVPHGMMSSRHTVGGFSFPTPERPSVSNAPKLTAGSIESSGRTPRRAMPSLSVGRSGLFSFQLDPSDRCVRYHKRASGSVSAERPGVMPTSSGFSFSAHSDRRCVGLGLGRPMARQLPLILSVCEIRIQDRWLSGYSFRVQTITNVRQRLSEHTVLYGRVLRLCGARSFHLLDSVINRDTALRHPGYALSPIHLFTGEPLRSNTMQSFS